MLTTSVRFVSVEMLQRSSPSPRWPSPGLFPRNVSPTPSWQDFNSHQGIKQNQDGSEERRKSRGTAKCFQSPAGESTRWEDIENWMLTKSFPLHPRWSGFASAGLRWPPLSQVYRKTPPPAPRWDGNMSGIDASVVLWSEIWSAVCAAENGLMLQSR